MLLIFAMVMVLALAACGSGNDKNEGSQQDSESSSDSKGVLRVGMEAAYAPFNWSQKDDSNGAVPIKDSKEYAAGYDVEIANALRKGLEWNLKS